MSGLLKMSSKKKEPTSEPLFDLEQQFILRLPPGPAMALKQDVQSSSNTLKDRLSIETQPDFRRANVRYGNQIFHGKMVDLPCIVETMKTVDMKTFYKTADVCQMLICKSDDDTSQDENESPKKKEKDKKYLWNHGITRPLKNVRKRRFRKTLKKKYMEQPDIEKEVKRLFRTDADAIDVKWEVITEEEKPECSGQMSITKSGGTSLKRTDTSTSLDNYAIFGDLSSSDEEEEKDINIMDSGEDDISRLSFSQHHMSFDSMDSSNIEGQDVMTDAENAELQGKLNELKRQVAEIRHRRASQEQSELNIADPEQKEKAQAILKKIIQEENEKLQEYEILSSMLSQS
ncbi:transcription initiation factor TFIID subunit 7-like isoform X2 [Ostrea edulis]|uniref:transcription initiation factor TFIID subunit 7-like isoform X2 n=1 Tax=Ostrea edulis TaxID=37623 RepID=UPI0020947B65|nr:transcription initiation factor TFIID subunit 7-like isoform X2 [Ostrea edulis]